MEELNNIVMTTVAIMATVGLFEIIYGYYIIYKEDKKDDAEKI